MTRTAPTNTYQYPFALSGEPRLLCSYRILEAAADAAEIENWADTIRRQLTHALRYFPELAGATVTVGRPDPNDDSYYAKARPWNDVIELPVDERPPMDTIFHELGHLAIHHLDKQGEPVAPSSEEFCSTFSTARMPGAWVERDEIAYLGEPSIESERWPTVCRKALRYRDEHGKQSHYIKRCKEWLGV